MKSHKKLSPKVLQKSNSSTTILAQGSLLARQSQPQTATSPPHISLKASDATFPRNSGGSDSKVLTPGQAGAPVRFETPTRSEPDWQATIDSYLKSQRTHPDSVSEINSRLKVLQGVIKKRMIEIYREKKSLSSVSHRSDDVGNSLGACKDSE